MEYTNVVVSADLQCILNLRQICLTNLNVEYNPSKFSGLIWRNKRFQVTFLLFSTGKISCSGARSYKKAHAAVRSLGRKLQKQGYNIKLQKIKLVTASAFYNLGRCVKYSDLILNLNFNHEPELFHAPYLKIDGINFTVFSTGKIIITGIKSKKQVNNIVLPTLIEILAFC